MQLDLAWLIPQALYKIKLDKPARIIEKGFMFSHMMQWLESCLRETRPDIKTVKLSNSTSSLHCLEVVRKENLSKPHLHNSLNPSADQHQQLEKPIDLSNTTNTTMIVALLWHLFQILVCSLDSISF